VGKALPLPKSAHDTVTVRPGRLSSWQWLALGLGAIVAVGSGYAAWKLEGPYGRSAGSDPCLYRKYDESSGALQLMMCDLNHNGLVDVWVEIDARGGHTIEMDPNEDGLVDRSETYGPDQKLLAIGYGRQENGSFTRVERFDEEQKERPALPHD
jgi:hypothetical protein